MGANGGVAKAYELSSNKLSVKFSRESDMTERTNTMGDWLHSIRAVCT